MKALRGFSLLELLIGVAITGAAVVLIMQAYSGILGSEEGAQARQNLELDLTALSRQMVQLGRVAKDCTKVVSVLPVYTSIQCNYEMADAVNHKVRFIRNGTESTIKFEEETGPGVWTTKNTYGGQTNFPITNFVVCNSADMSALTCTLEPSKISTQFIQVQTAGAAALPPVLLSNRFYRFGIEHQVSKTGAKRMHQGSFFVRNPAATGEPTYAWGTQG